jgi:hypothetical protein
MVENRKFSFEGKEYETRVILANGRYEVAVFLDGGRANGYAYSVDFETSVAMKQSIGVEAVTHLMELAESDVRSGLWNQYLKASL